LILAVPPEEAARLLRDQPLGVPVTDIGRISSARGLTAKHADGTVKVLERTGWLY
jgi:thiamine monophosphate kinase